MTRGRPGPRWLPSYFRAMRRRCQQGIGGDQRLKLTERAATESLGLCRHAPPLPVRETEPACRDVFPQRTIFFLEIVDDVALLLVDPAGHGDDEELQRLRKRTHTGRA